MANVAWFAGRLRELREAAGWTQEQLAERRRGKAEAVARWEAGKRNRDGRTYLLWRRRWAWTVRLYPSRQPSGRQRDRAGRRRRRPRRRRRSTKGPAQEARRTRGRQTQPIGPLPACQGRIRLRLDGTGKQRRSPHPSPFRSPGPPVFEPPARPQSAQSGGNKLPRRTPLSAAQERLVLVGLTSNPTNGGSSAPTSAPSSVAKAAILCTLVDLNRMPICRYGHLFAHEIET